jgi:hypothetical protein
MTTPHVMKRGLFAFLAKSTNRTGPKKEFPAFQTTTYPRYSLKTKGRGGRDDGRRNRGVAGRWFGMASGNWRVGDSWPRSFIAAGPIMAALAGAGVGGAVGGLTGALIGMGIPEYDAKRYEGRVKDGGILLSVHSGSSEETKKAKHILERAGAQDISSTGEAHGEKNAVPVW